MSEIEAHEIKLNIYIYLNREGRRAFRSFVPLLFCFCVLTLSLTAAKGETGNVYKVSLGKKKPT